eukprot:CAMPEP_0113477908 /NCGR_PEP_ID=MMETSP0014_2-20120614/20454_1 /TAXON_ID=2857 /ORGANISM="Nitzschia sp." /LENGTH=1501 /DNA_ID=CAMNT_0000371025 /DNA_START=68 /DNA_END=4573 /DNA_ORIENTATION=+ /assembly_acc=CAM_ASM_000159
MTRQQDRAVGDCDATAVAAQAATSPTARIDDDDDDYDDHRPTTATATRTFTTTTTTLLDASSRSLAAGSRRRGSGESVDSGSISPGGATSRSGRTGAFINRTSVTSFLSEEQKQQLAAVGIPIDGHDDNGGRSEPLLVSSLTSLDGTGRRPRHRHRRRSHHHHGGRQRHNHHGRYLRRHSSADGVDMIMDDSSSSQRRRRTGIPVSQQESLSNSFSNSLSFRRPSTRRRTSDDNIRIIEEEFTVNKLRFSLLDIYGRTKEEDMLNDIISRAAAATATTVHAGASDSHQSQSKSDAVAAESTEAPTLRNLEKEEKKRRKEFVLISGESGTGKTALALSIKQHVQRMRGAFISGKFDNNVGGLRVGGSSSSSSSSGSEGHDHKDQNNHETTEERQQPYRPILTACSELCCQLLAMKYRIPNAFRPIGIKNTPSSSSRNNNNDDDSGSGEDTETSLTPSTFGFDNEDDWKDLLKIVPDLETVIGTSAGRNDDDTNNDTNGSPLENSRNSKHSLSSQRNTTTGGESHDGNDKNNNGGNVDVDVNVDAGEINGSSLQGSKIRFHYLLRKFFRGVAAFLDGPLVFVLDDMQWADFASLGLLEGLLLDNGATTTSLSVSSSSVTTTTTNTSRCSSGIMDTPGHRSQRVLQKNGSSNNNIIVIGLYRSNEVAPTHMLSKLIRDMKQRPTLNVTEMYIGNLEEDDIVLLLSDLLSTTCNDRLLELARICHQKTAGNAFFVIQYLTRLNERGLLKYNFGLTKWYWDEERIKLETDATSNVVDLMTEKLLNLAPCTLRLLQVATCLGSSFQEQSLYKAWGAVLDPEKEPRCRETFQQSIKQATDEGLWEKDENRETYHWAHDSILDASVELMDSEELKEMQYQIGLGLVHLINPKQRETVFSAVNLLNAGTPLDLDVEEKLELAEMNLLAAQSGVDFSAFESASKYINRCVALLPHDYWTTRPQLGLQIHSIGAEVEGCLGRIDALESHCNVVLQQDLPLLDKLRVYHVLLDSIANRQRLPEATSLCLKILEDLGFTFPRSNIVITIKTIIGVLRVQAKAGSITPDDIARMKPMTDRRLIEAMKLMDKLATYCYLSGNPLLAVTMLERLKLTTRYGICDSSAILYAGLGVILSGKLFNFQAGSAYARFSLLVLEKIGAKHVHARTLFASYAFVLPWTQYTRSVLKYLLEAYEKGLAHGDTETAMYAIMSYIYKSFQSGRSLESIEVDCRVYLAQMKELKREKARRQTTTIYQTILNFQGKSVDPCVLSGEAMDQTDMIELAGAEHDKVVLAMIQAFRMQLLATFGRYEEGADFAISVDDRLADQIPCSTMVVVDPFFRSLALFGMARKCLTESNGIRSRKFHKYYRHARKARRMIKRYVKKGNPNVRHLECFLDAEKAALDSRKYQVARNQYESATVIASRGSFLHDAALANERFGIFLLNQIHDEEMAAFRLRRAVQLYNEWGSVLKASMLEKDYRELLYAHPEVSKTFITSGIKTRQRQLDDDGGGRVSF